MTRPGTPPTLIAAAQRPNSAAPSTYQLRNPGQAEGVFRRDVPERWLLTTYLTLVHAAGREVAMGAMTADEGERALISTLLAAYSRVPSGGSSSHSDQH